MSFRLAAIAALIAGPAFAAEAPAAATPPADAAVADQIEAYLKASPVLDVGDADGTGGTIASGLDRRLHGQVSVAAGTGGYRSVYLRSDYPVGETGRVSIAIEDTRMGRSRGGPYAGPGRSAARFAERQRCDLEGLTPPRALDVTGGPNGRCVMRPGGW